MKPYVRRQKRNLVPRKLLWDIISHQADASTKNEKEKKEVAKVTQKWCPANTFSW